MPGHPAVQTDAAKSGTPPTGEAAVDATLEPELQAHIGRQLRAMYNEVVNEPVPDRLLQLLQDLERKRNGNA